MLSIIRHSLSASSCPLPCRISVRRNVVKLNRKYHAKVSALPFALTKDDAIKHVGPWASMASMGKGLLGSLLAKYLPGSTSEPLQPDDIKAVYIPVWFIDGEVTLNMTKSGTEVAVMIHSLNSYLPGFSFDPLSTLSFSQPGLEELTVPFTPELRHQRGIDVSCLPFSISPVQLPKVVESLTPSQSKMPGSVTFDPESADFTMLAAYPVLLPIYLMRYDMHIPSVPEILSLTCMVQAHSKNALTYIDLSTGAAEVGGLLRETPFVTPGSLLHRFTHAMDDISTWEAHGTSYGFSSIGIPITHPSLDSFNQGISVWVDEKIQSKSNMTALAEYGVDMDHPCVRTYTKEEVDANRTFLAASGDCFTIHEFLRNASKKKLQGGKVMMEASGKLVKDPEAVLEYLKKKVDNSEKQKGELKPQWLREWQDSRSPRKSAMS